MSILVLLLCCFSVASATTDVSAYCHTLALHDALPIWDRRCADAQGIGEMSVERPFESRALFGKRQKLSSCRGERQDLDILPQWVALTSGVDDGASRGI